MVGEGYERVEELTTMLNILDLNGDMLGYGEEFDIAIVWEGGGSTA